MNSASTTPMATQEFPTGARNVIRSLRDAYLRDESLADDLDVVLGACAGPEGLAGARRQQRKRRWPFPGDSTTPSTETVARLGRAVTRVERMLRHLVAIAKEREWEPPYPDVAGAIARANSLRAQQPWLPGDFVVDLAHLRRLALVALDLLDMLSDDESEGIETTGGTSRADGSRT